MRRNRLADFVLDIGEYLLGLLDAGTGGRSGVPSHLSRVNIREEVLPDDRQHRKRSDHKYRESTENDGPVIEAPRQQTFVVAPKTFESVVEVPVDLAKKA